MKIYLNTVLGNAQQFTDILRITQWEGNAVLFLLLFNVSLIVAHDFSYSLFIKNEIMIVKIFGIFDVLIYNFLKSLKFVFLVHSYLMALHLIISLMHLLCV